MKYLSSDKTEEANNIENFLKLSLSGCLSYVLTTYLKQRYLCSSYKRSSPKPDNKVTILISQVNFCLSASKC